MREGTKVYVALVCEPYEGCACYGVFDTHEKALNAAIKAGWGMTEVETWMINESHDERVDREYHEKTEATS